MSEQRAGATKRPGRPPGKGVADATKDRILEAAADVFADKGFYGAAVDDIVRASDTSKGSFYFHFPNKHGIFTALLDHLTSRLVERAERAIAVERDPIARVEAALQAVFTAFGQRKRLARLLLVEAAGVGHGVDEHLVSIHDRFASLIERYLNEAVQGGQIPAQDTRLAACAWMGALNEVVIRWLYTGQPERLETVPPSLRALLLRSVGYVEASADNRSSEQVARGVNGKG